MSFIMQFLPGIITTVFLSFVSIILANLIPNHLISGGVFALIIGMFINPFISKYKNHLSSGINLSSKQLLRAAIVLMGLSLSFSQVLSVGKFSIFVMCFTLLTAFLGGYVIGKIFNINWKLSSLISAGTGICGGSAIAAISPVIEAKERDIAYALSATFIFDIIMVILFPIAGKYLGMSDIGFGLWTGTAVNDTSAVVAAGYAFSDTAGAYSVIVKLTRTLSIIPIVLIFSFINKRIKTKNSEIKNENIKNTLIKIFPYFILLFLVMVAIKSSGILPQFVTNLASEAGKFFMIMALGAIGLKTNFKEIANSGILPMIHGFIVSTLVVVVSYAVQYFLHQL